METLILVHPEFSSAFIELGNELVYQNSEVQVIY